jgi:hypothetical protein
LLVSCLGFAQNEKVLSTQNGFEIAYTAQKIGDGGKDKWLITVSAVNKTEDKLFYSLPTIKQTDGSFAVNTFSSLFSSKVTVRNATGFLASDGVKVKGEPTNFYTLNKAGMLFQYDPGRIYNYENTINVKDGDTPVVTITHTYPLKKLSEFNLEPTAALIEGEYKSTCATTVFSIHIKEEVAKTYLIQSINGRQIKWLRTSSNLFVKETDTGSTLSYNKEKRVFNFSSSDGIACEWQKL